MLPWALKPKTRAQWAASQAPWALAGAAGAPAVNGGRTKGRVGLCKTLRQFFVYVVGASAVDAGFLEGSPSLSLSLSLPLSVAQKYRSVPRFSPQQNLWLGN